MTQPRTRGGFTPVANELLDAVLQFGFSKRQLVVMLAIIRKTYGYNKAEDDMTVTQLAELAGLARQNASTALRELVDRIGAVDRRKGRYGYVLSIHAETQDWHRDDSARCASNPEAGRLDAKRRSSRGDAHNRQPQNTASKDRDIYPPQGLPDCVPCDAWADYVQHRRQIRKPLTEAAARRAANTLLRLHGEGQSVRQVIDKSIECGWTGLFGFKHQTGQAAGSVWGDAI